MLILISILQSVIESYAADEKSIVAYHEQQDNRGLYVVIPLKNVML